LLFHALALKLLLNFCITHRNVNVTSENLSFDKLPLHGQVSFSHNKGEFLAQLNIYHLPFCQPFSQSVTIMEVTQHSFSLSSQPVGQPFKISSNLSSEVSQSSTQSLVYSVKSLNQSRYLVSQQAV
jgi:hypothetical protein